DICLHIQGEDGICHADLRRNTVSVSEKSHYRRPNDDLLNSLRSAYGIARDGLSHYKNYVKASLRQKAPYPLQDASMESSIKAYYDAVNRGVKPPMSAVEGTAVVQACEAAVRHFAGASVRE